MSDITSPRHIEALAGIDTRFYSFQGPWGEHQAIVVDTETGQEYEILNRDHLTAPWHTRAVSTEQIEAQARLIDRTSQRGGGIMREGSPAQHHSRQCFNRGLGYTPVHI